MSCNLLLKAWQQLYVGQKNCIWNNNLICQNGKSLYLKEFDVAGVKHVSDLFYPDGRTIPFETLVRSNIMKKEFFLKWIGLIYSIPKHLRILEAPSENGIMTLGTGTDIQEINLETTSSREIYSLLITLKKSIPLGQCIWNRLFNVQNENNDLNWQEIYLVATKCTTDVKSCVFQYKVLNDILPVRKQLQRW